MAKGKGGGKNKKPPPKEDDVLIVKVPTSPGPTPPPELFITCPGNQNYQVTEPETCLVVSDLPEPAISGGVPPFDIQYNPTEGSSFCEGTTPVQITVTDSSPTPQVKQCQFNVIVTQIPAPPPGLIFDMNYTAPAEPLAGWDSILGPANLGVLYNRTRLATGGPSGQPAYELAQISAPGQPAWGGQFYHGWAGNVNTPVPTVGQSRYIRLRHRISPDSVLRALSWEDGSAGNVRDKYIIVSDGCGSNCRIILYIWGEGNGDDTGYHYRIVSPSGAVLPDPDLAHTVYTRGTWFNLQYQILYSSSPGAADGALRMWVNNNAQGSPNLQFPAIIINPSTTYLLHGGYMDQGLAADGVFKNQFADFEVDDSFDAGWHV